MTTQINLPPALCIHQSRKAVHCAFAACFDDPVVAPEISADFSALKNLLQRQQPILNLTLQRSFAAQADKDLAAFDFRLTVDALIPLQPQGTLLHQGPRWIAYCVVPSTNVPMETWGRQLAARFLLLEWLRCPIPACLPIFINPKFTRNPAGDFDPSTLFSLYDPGQYDFDAVFRQYLAPFRECWDRLPDATRSTFSGSSKDSLKNTLIPRALLSTISEWIQPSAVATSPDDWWTLPGTPSPEARAAWDAGHSILQLMYDYDPKATPPKVPAARSLLERGIVSINSIPEAQIANLQPIQQLQIRAIQTGELQWSTDGKAELTDWLPLSTDFPIFHLDFETYRSTIPIWPVAHPNENIPFQFSVHQQRHLVQDSARCPHIEFLHTDPITDPRPALIRALLDAIPLEAKGIIAVFTDYERDILKGLRHFIRIHDPALADNFEPWLQFYCPEVIDPKATPRLLNLHFPFCQKGNKGGDPVNAWLYHPKQANRTSIKTIHPALTHTNPYASLPIHDGLTASTKYLEAVFPTNPDNPIPTDQTFQALKKYCKQDTACMVDLLNTLYDLSGLLSSDRLPF